MNFNCFRRLLGRRIPNNKATISENAEMQRKRNDLYHRIKKWQAIQALYMPSVSEDQRNASERHAAHPECIPLYLPSAMSPNLRPAPDLLEKEKQLWLAQLNDALVELRRLLHITLGLWEYKYTQLGPSQRANTRARSMMMRFKEKVNRVTERYRAARTALVILDPVGSWSQEFLKLKPEHVRLPGRHEDDEGEGRRELSWIWMASSTSDINTCASEEEIGDSESFFFLHLHNCERGHRFAG